MDADGREQRTVVRREMTPPDMMMHGGGPAPYARIERGGRVPGHWMDPRFHVRDFGRYGFYQPMWGGRWIRYYDDALLVDPYGQVIDGQWGMKWDEYAGDWRRGPDGIPEYVGTGDYVPGDADYAAVRGPHGYGSAPGYGYGGYAYPGAGAITIVETVTTTAPTVEERVWYEEAPRRR